MTYFNGPVDESEVPRLSQQHERIKQFMLTADKWYTLQELRDALDYPEASISAQLRHLRKVRFGAYTVNKRRREKVAEAESGTWEYRVER